MSWVTVIWSMSASACLTMAAVHLFIWFNKRTSWGSLFFTLAAVATAAMAYCELSMMRAETPVHFVTAMRWEHVPILALIVSLTAFVLIQMRAGRRWLAWLAITLRTVSLLLNFTVGHNIHYSEVAGLRHITFLGETVSAVDAAFNPLMLIAQLSVMLFLAFLVDAAITVWRRGDKRQAVIVGGSIIFFILTAFVQGTLAVWHIVNLPVMISVFSLGITVAMGSELIGASLRAALLSDDVSKKDRWLDLAADSVGVGVWVWDFKSNLFVGTERAYTMYGFSPDDPVSYDKFLSIAHPEDLDMIKEAAQKAIQSGADVRLDFRIVLPDGSIRWIRILGKVDSSLAGAPERMTGVSLDITDRKDMELDLVLKRKELAHVNRVLTMGQLANTLAHELNQPLGAILRNAEAAEIFLNDPSPDLDELREILSDIRKDDKRAGAVIDRIRSMMKQREFEPCRLDLGLLTSEVISLLQSDADKRRVRMDLAIDRATPPVYGDQVQLQQVLINLLINSFDALEGNLPDKRLVSVGVRPVGAMAEVAVRDNGHGIAADKLFHLFEPFFSSKSTGLGMGLTISRDIITMHRGRLWADNNEGGGMTFTFSLLAAEGGNQE